MTRERFIEIVTSEGLAEQHAQLLWEHLTFPVDMLTEEQVRLTTRLLSPLAEAIGIGVRKESLN